MGSKRKRGAKDSSNAGSIPQKKAKKSAPPTSAAASKPNLEKLPFVEAPSIDERKREAALYELLGSEDADDRISAADCIVSGLLGGDGVPEPVLQRHLDRRLFRGLASGRNASRLGFSLVIAEILGQLFGKKALARSKYTALTFEKTLGFLIDKTQATGNIPGQEERDHFFGLLFGIESFVRSQTLFTGTSRWATVLTLLLDLSKKKIWLRSQCGWVIVQAMSQMGKKDAESTLNKLADAGLAKTPEGVAIWLVALGQYPDLKVKPWHNPLSKKFVGDLAAVLKESVRESEGERGEKSRNNKQAGWTAQLHFVWDIILSHYAGETTAESEDFELFWSRAVDDTLFSKGATDGQKFKGFMVFQKMLEGLADSHEKVQRLFSRNFMACLMNQAAKEDRYLHRAATKALKAIESVVSSRPGALVPVLESLLGKNGIYNFDQRTNTRTVDKLLQSINPDTEKEVFDTVRHPIASLAQQDDSAAQSTLRVYIDYLSKSLNASTSPNSSDAGSTSTNKSSTGLALGELSRLAYSRPKDIPAGALTEQIKDLCRARLESSLAKLTRRADDFETFCNVISSIDSSSMAMDEAIVIEKDAALSRMRTLLKRKTKTTQDKSLAQGLAMLHAVSIFQLYNEDPDAMEVLSDLAEFSERLKKGKLGEKSAGSSEFLVEILLSMVARPSSLMRQVSQQVFEAFTSQVSAEGLELLTGPLASSESTKGQQELFNTEDDAMDVDGGSSSEDDVENASDVEVGPDVEFADLNDADVGESSEDEDDEEEDEEENGDEDRTETNGEKDPEDFDERIGGILNSHRLDKDMDAISSASDSDVSDSEMMKLDEQLSTVFKHKFGARQDSKKQKKDAKQSVVNFKHRILDLLDIFVRNETLNPLAFSVLTPLLHLMRTTSTRPLAARACEVILNYQKGLRKARGNRADAGGEGDGEGDGGGDAEDLLALLVEVHDEAGKDNSHAYAKAASAASLIVASAMFAADRASVKRVAAVYAKTQSDWVLGEARLQNSFFADWNNWCQNHASQARN